MDESIAAALDLIAARAKMLSLDYRAGKLWEGDLQRGVSEIHGSLETVSIYARNNGK